MLALWFGLAAGLAEGVGRVVFQEVGLKPWQQPSIAIEIIWIATLFDAFLFLVAGLLWVGMARFFSVLKAIEPVFLFFLTLLLLDGLLLMGRIHGGASTFLAIGLAVLALRKFRPWVSGSFPFFRRTLGWLFLLALVAGGAVEIGGWARERLALARRPPASPDAPNILFVVLDTLRADHVSALGYHRETTPNIDALAQEGIIFENGVASSSFTLPSHVSFLTGRHPVGDAALSSYYDGRFETLGEWLQQKGYRTGGFSANRFFFSRRHKFDRGFDHFADYFDSVEDAVGRTMLGLPLMTWWKRLQGDENHIGRKSALVVNQEVLEWLQQDRKRPWFAFLNYFDIHDPYLPPEPFRSRFSKTPSPGGILNDAQGRQFLNLSTAELQSEMDAYDGSVTYVDHALGGLLAELRRQSRLDNTIVIVTSDHGESFGEHGLTAHRSSLYWELLRVPIILWAPGRIPGDHRIDIPVSIASLPATVLGIAGIPNPSTLIEDSLVPLWQEGSASLHSQRPLAQIARIRFAGAENTPAYEGSIKALVGPTYHYIQHETLGEELYRWRTDPREELNLAKTPEGSQVCTEMAEQLTATVGRISALPPKLAGGGGKN